MTRRRAYTPSCSIRAPLVRMSDLVVSQRRKLIRMSDLPDFSERYSSLLEALDFAIGSLWTSITAGTYRIRGPRVLEMRRDLPYSILDMPALPGVLIVVNREHKPLGSTTDEWVIYEECLGGHVRLSRAQVAEVVEPGETAALFSDRTAPWGKKTDAEKYLARLERLRDFVSHGAVTRAQS